MPWCPKCKCEYREGITTCVDCKVDLVEDLQAVKEEEKKASKKSKKADESEEGAAE